MSKINTYVRRYLGAMEYWHRKNIKGGLGSNLSIFLLVLAITEFTLIAIEMPILKMFNGLTPSKAIILVLFINAPLYLYLNQQYDKGILEFSSLPEPLKKKWIKRAFKITLFLFFILVLSFLNFNRLSNANEHRMVHITPLSSDHYTAEEEVRFTVQNDRGTVLYTFPILRSVRTQQTYILSLDSSQNRSHAIATQDILHEGANVYSFVPVNITGAGALTDSSERWYIDVSFTHLDRQHSYHSDTFQIIHKADLP